MSTPWNDDGNIAYRQTLKHASNKIAEHYFSGNTTLRAGSQIRECASHLRVYPDATYGTFTDAWYCKHRHCPICQSRKALRWQSRMHQVLDMAPEALEGKWVYLTLTVRNCHLTALGQTIDKMETAFRRLRNRSFWRSNVLGGIKFIEVDPDLGDYQYAHPHFHCLIQVRPSMYQGKNYVSEQHWAEAWQACLNAPFVPQVHARRLKGVGDGLRNEILRSVSYSMKPRLETPPRGWFLSMADEIKDKRLVQPFGQMREWFSDLKYQDDCELQAQREEIREGHEPTIHRWDSCSRAYRKD